jgi:hypothetical protein
VSYLIIATNNLDETINKTRNVMNFIQTLSENRGNSVLMLILLLRRQKPGDVDYVLVVSAILTASIFNTSSKNHIVPKEEEYHFWQQINSPDLY